MGGKIGILQLGSEPKKGNIFIVLWSNWKLRLTVNNLFYHKIHNRPGGKQMAIDASTTDANAKKKTQTDRETNL